MDIKPNEQLAIEDIQKKRREGFAKRYEEKFGEKVQITTNNLDTPTRGFALNYYGVKSTWL